MLRRVRWNLKVLLIQKPNADIGETKANLVTIKLALALASSLGCASVLSRQESLFVKCPLSAAFYVQKLAFPQKSLHSS